MSYKRVDRNQSEIVRELRKRGYSVQSIASVGHGCPDLIVGWRGQNYLFELKAGALAPSRKKLNKDEATWHASWRGQVDVVESIEDVMGVLT